MRWRGGPIQSCKHSRRGQSGGMSGDKGTEKTHSESLCTMINHTRHFSSRRPGIDSRETAEKGGHLSASTPNRLVGISVEAAQDGADRQRVERQVRRNPIREVISGRKKRGECECQCAWISGGEKRKGCRESWKQKRKCVGESREGEQCFIDRDGRGPGDKSGHCGASPDRGTPAGRHTGRGSRMPQPGRRLGTAERRANGRGFRPPACRRVEYYIFT
jgi:hypothetical protein